MDRPGSSLVDIKPKLASLTAKHLIYFGSIHEAEGVATNLFNYTMWTAILLVGMRDKLSDHIQAKLLMISLSGEQRKLPIGKMLCIARRTRGGGCGISTSRTILGASDLVKVVDMVLGTIK